MSVGFIKLHRKICKWEWYQDQNAFRLFIHLLLNCNHEDGRWQGNIIKRGEVITGRKVLSKALNLSQQEIRTSLDKLKSTNEITINATNRFSIITLVKYDSYQSRENIATSKSTSQAHSKQPTSNHKQEGKEVKEGKEKGNGRFAPPSFDKVDKYIKSKGYCVDPSAFIDFYNSKGWMVGKNKMKCWESAVSSWNARNKSSDPVKQPYGAGAI